MSTTKSKHRSEQAITGSWQLDPQRSSVEFRTRSIWGLAGVKGRFGDYQAPHRDLGMIYSPLGMISPRSKLIVKAHLIADTARAA